MALKLVLVGPRGTVYKDGRARIDLIQELVVFIQRMTAKGVQVALWARHPTTYQIGGKAERVEVFLSRASGVNVPYYQAAFGQLPDRKAGGSADPILKAVGVGRHEVVLVGNEHTDMVAGVNNQLLLVRPEWYPSNLDYGFAVDSLAELARFCELFGLRQHPIYWSIDLGSLRMRAMGPYSTLRPDFAAFGAAARDVAKHGIGDERFWFLLIVSSLFFSGLMHQIDYICTFPGHNPAVASAVRQGIDTVMTILGKCFRKQYLPDLIVRHTASVKSQSMKAERRNFLNHLNTLHLNSRPRIYDRLPNKASIRLSGKRVLVVDDICTAGRSLDTARAYIEAAGGVAILFSWLKTINTPFAHLHPTPKLSPFQPNLIASEPSSQTLPYHQFIVDPDAPSEIQATMDAYRAWKWP